MAHRTGTGNRDTVLEVLRRGIVTARLTPGARLIERDVAAELGVSRTPVREALTRLEREGLLTAVPGRQRSLLQIAPRTAPQKKPARCAGTSVRPPPKPR